MIGLEEDDDIELNVEGTEDVLSEFNIVPREGKFLGLDISKNSSGICFYNNGEKIVVNSTLKDVQSPHKEVILRRELAQDILEVVGKGTVLDLVVIEDAFVGENAETARLLYALNTAIDELILDGKIACKEFVRVSNKKWKSWISSLDIFHEAKGMNDKEKIRLCLSNIGIFEEGEGYQDRLDSAGLIVGYFLKGNEDVKHQNLRSKRSISLADVNIAYDEDSGYLFYGQDDVLAEDIEVVNMKRVSKKKILEKLKSNPNKIYMTGEKVHLGNSSKELGISVIPDGGYLAFWVKRSKLHKYI